MNNALKAIGKTDTELRVANYMVLFGGRDLEGIASPRKNKDGTTGEFFTKATVLDSPYTNLDLVAVDWEHGIAPRGEPGPDDVLGRVDWKSARVDERGVFVERVLDRRNRYVQYLEALIDAGLIGNSTEAVPDGVVLGRNGEIKVWPIKRDTLTVAPMDPRMIQGNTLQAVKALADRWPALDALIESLLTGETSPDDIEAPDGMDAQTPDMQTPEAGQEMDGESMDPAGEDMMEEPEEPEDDSDRRRVLTLEIELFQLEGLDA